MTTENIFGNDILSGDLTTSLVPELGQEDISLNLTPTSSNFSEPLTQEISLTEPEIITEESENNIDLNTPTVNNLTSLNIDPLIGNQSEEFQVSNIDLDDTSFAPPQSELQLLGGFGDYDGGNDVTLEIEDTDGDVIETFKLTGEGQATLYRDEEYQYVFFSGVDETTKVEIDSTSNIKFGDYIGDSLKIETTGSIEGGDIVLSEPDETGLVLKSGIEGTATGNIYTNKYQITDLEGDFEEIHPTDINNLGQVVGFIQTDGTSKGFFYDDESGFKVLDRYAHSRILGINDSGDVVGRFLNVKKYSTNIYDQRPFYTQGEEYIEPLAGGIPNSFDNLVDINNSGVVAGFGQIRKTYNNFRFDDSIIYDGDTRTRLFIDGHNHTTSINDLGHVVGFSYESKQSFIYQDETVSWIEKSPEHISNWARDINNSGQIVGAISERVGTNSIHKVFIYSDGVMQIIDKNAGVAGIIKNNDHNQIVFSTAYTSSEGLKPYIYQNGELTNLNDLIDPEFRNEGWYLQSALEINNKGQILGKAWFQGKNRGVILSPPPTPNYIKIGNISTFGDTVLLQGNEISLTGKAITTQGGEITFEGATTTERNLTIDTSVVEDEVITDGGDIIFTGTLDSSGTNNLRLQAGTGNVLFGDAVGGEATFNNINIFGANTVTAEADITSNGRIKINATEDITAKNITSETGNVKLISEEKSITTEDITTKNPEGKNIVIEAIEGIDVANLDAGELGRVSITSGEIVENDTETLEDDTVVVGDISTESITGKAIRAVGTGSFTATGDIMAHDGRITVAVTNDVNTKSINSLAKSINLISTEGAVTVEGELNSEKGGVAIHAANDINTQKIRSFDGAVALSSYNGEVTLEDDLNTVRGGVTIAAKEGVEVARITTGVGEVNIGSGGDIIANGNISTNVGYVNLKAGGRLDVQRVTTNDGYVSIGADGNVEIQSLATNSGAINLISATGSVAVAGSIDTAGSYVAIEAALEIIASAIEANGGGVDLIANSDFDGATQIASGGVVTDVTDSLGEIILEQQEFISEVVNDLIYNYRGIGEFVIGVLYQTAANNLEDAFNIGQFFLPLKLTERDKRNWTRIIESQSTAFQLGRELANAASIVQGIIELFTGGAAVISGSSLCLAGAGATLGASCFAAAPAIAGGAALSAHGISLIKNGIENNTDANLIDDLLAPQKMASTGGADGSRGLARKIGASQEGVDNALEVLGTKKIEQLEGRLVYKEKYFDRTDSVEKERTVNLLNRVLDKSKELIYNVSKSFDFVDNEAKGIKDVDGINDIRATIRQNRVRDDGTQLIKDTELNTALKEHNDFFTQYDRRVSGAYANRFGRASSSSPKLDTVQAQGELNAARDILDGNTVLGNDVTLRGLPDDVRKQTNPEYLATMLDKSTRLVEVKTPTGTPGKITSNLNDAIKQITGSPLRKQTTDKAYISVDYTNAKPVTGDENFLFEKIERSLKTDKINKIPITPGTQLVEFVELTYKDARTGNQVRRMLVQVINGKPTLIGVN